MLQTYTMESDYVQKYTKIIEFKALILEKKLFRCLKIDVHST